MTWIELHADVFSNKKVVRAAAKLTAGNVETMVGHLARLWTWAMDHAEDGDLFHLPPDTIAHAANWRGRSGRFVAILREVGLLDAQNCLDNWSEYAGKLIERRKKDRERKQAERDGKRGVPEGSPETSAGHPQDSEPASTGRPGVTVPRPDQNIPSDDDVSGALRLSGDGVDEALVVLQRVTWYPHDDGRDRAVLRGATVSGDALVTQVRRWVEYVKKTQHPKRPRSALRGWLKRAWAVIDEEDAAAKAEEAASSRPPVSPHEFIRAKGLQPEEEARLLSQFPSVDEQIAAQRARSGGKVA